MARCDYHGCAVCDGKAFYNANMSLDDDGGYWGAEVLALCSECAKTHKLIVLAPHPPATPGKEGSK
jgi:hypothetical protein